MIWFFIFSKTWPSRRLFMYVFFDLFAHFRLVWDRRKREQVFSVKVGTDYVSSLKCLDEASTMACTAGDGIVSVININGRKLVNKVSGRMERRGAARRDDESSGLIVCLLVLQSQPYDAELTCGDLFCSNTKLAVGTTSGSLLLYSWGQFSSWNDEFPGLDEKKHAINCMIPVTENIVVTGLDDGLLR